MLLYVKCSNDVWWLESSEYVRHHFHKMSQLKCIPWLPGFSRWTILKQRLNLDLMNKQVREWRRELFFLGLLPPSPFVLHTVDLGEVKGQAKIYFCFFSQRVLEVLTMCSVSWSTFNQSWRCLFLRQHPCPACAIYHPQQDPKTWRCICYAVCSFTELMLPFRLSDS